MNTREKLTGSSGRIYTLDALKFFAAVLIVFHHYQQVTEVRFSTINFFGGFVYFGYMVELFFLLSGFFTFNGLERDKQKSLFEFMMHKWLRLFPMTGISVTVSALFQLAYRHVAGDWWSYGTVLGIWTFTKSFFLVNAGGYFSIRQGV